MAQPATLLHIAQPCAESWDAMTPTASGRHCTSCQKTVVDFTQKTDAEILAYLARVQDKACGRFRAEQLAVALVPPASASRWRTWLGAALAASGVLGASRAAAQTSGNYYSGGPAPTVASPSSTAAAAVPIAASDGPAATRQPSEPLVLKGVVTDAQTGEYLPGVTVLLKGTQQGTNTNRDGQFILSVPGADVAAATIVFSCVGYVHEELPAARVVNMPVVAIQMSTQMLGGLEIITVRKPYPWHPRRFFNWGKYWLAKPFQPR